MSNEQKSRATYYAVQTGGTLRCEQAVDPREAACLCIAATIAPYEDSEDEIPVSTIGTEVSVFPHDNRPPMRSCRNPYRKLTFSVAKLLEDHFHDMNRVMREKLANVLEGAN